MKPQLKLILVFAVFFMLSGCGPKEIVRIAELESNVNRLKIAVELLSNQVNSKADKLKKKSWVKVNLYCAEESCDAYVGLIYESKKDCEKERASLKTSACIQMETY